MKTMTLEKTETESYPEKTLAWIMQQIKAGKTVHITTMTKITVITLKTVKTWDKAGNQLFKIDSTGLRLAAGNRFDLITSNTSALCKISAF